MSEPIRRRRNPAAIAVLLIAGTISSGACSLASEGTTPFEPPRPDVGEEAADAGTRAPASTGPDRVAGTAPSPAAEGAIPRAETKSRYGNPESYVVFGQRYEVLDSSRGYVQEGIASWYGEPFHGRRTSNGEVYDMHALTAAHKSLPLPTYVLVTNLDNGRQVILRVNDRGPFHGDRIIDVSFAAAERLGIVGPGTARVEVRALDPPASDRGR
jgi:rare lipoprotein A (peptidoglycan hydrolase)